MSMRAVLRDTDHSERKEGVVSGEGAVGCGPRPWRLC